MKKIFTRRTSYGSLLNIFLLTFCLCIGGILPVSAGVLFDRSEANGPVQQVVAGTAQVVDLDPKAFHAHFPIPQHKIHQSNPDVLKQNDGYAQ